MRNEAILSAREAFRELAESVAVTGQRDFFEAMVERLGQLLGADHVMIATVEEPGLARTMAFWSRGQCLETLSYPLAGTPCERVIGCRPCFFPRAVARKFPEDRVLADLGVESYLGIPMFTPEGEAVGILAAMTNDEAEAGQLSHDLAGIAAAQAGAELARRRAEESVHESRRQLNTLISHLPGMAYQCLNDADWSMLFVNQRVEELTGYSAEAFLTGSISLARVIHESDRQWVADQVDAAIETRESFNLTYRLRHRCGHIRWVWEQGQGVFSEQGELQWLEGFIHDITEQQQSRHLQEAVYQIASAVTARSGQAFFHGLAEHLACAVGADGAYIATLDKGKSGVQELALQALVLDGRSRGSMCGLESTAFTERTIRDGYSIVTAGADEPFPMFTDSPRSGPAQACVGVRLDSREGRTLGLMAVLFNEPIENPELSMSVMRIFGSGASAELERQHYEQSIRTLAYQDTVTGLPNRIAFMEQLERAGGHYRDDGRSFSLVFLDLRRFKELNDTRGTHFGDSVLYAVAERFAEVLGPNDYLARLGGNEYAVLLPDTSKEMLQSAMAQLRNQLETPLVIGDEQCSISTSIGGASFPGDAEGVDDLYQHASIALHHAKLRHSGMGLYDTEMARTLHRKEYLAGRLREAMRRQQLMLHFQPQFDLVSGDLVGAEALCRWHDSELGWVSPGEFIPLAEERGLIHELSDWVLSQGCRYLQAWKAEGRPLPGTLSVNISAEQLDSEELVEHLRHICMPVEPQELTLELTESAFMDDPELAIMLSQNLREAGFRVAIDDFGTGYSSLSYLRDLHVDTLKIDMSFVRNMLRDERDRAIVETIVAMARTLGLRTVAEGVETSEHEKALQAMDCGASQGFYYGRPCDAEAFSRQWLSG